MRAAVVRDVGAPPEVDDVAEPAGETVEVLAAPINPIDLAVSRGVLATGHPELPYVPGCEAVGRTADGRTVWIFGGSLGRTSQGAIGERAADHGADATLRLGDHTDLVAALKEAFGGDGPGYVFDPLWAEPGAAAVLAAAPYATIVNLGQSAGATATLSSEAVRFKNLAILGNSVYAAPFDVLEEHYRRLVEHAVSGDIRLDVERVPLDAVADAWRRQAEGARTKLVVVP